MFDRTIDKATSTFEFYVPQAMNTYFLQMMQYFEQQGILSNLQKLPNRVQAGEEV